MSWYELSQLVSQFAQKSDMYYNLMEAGDLTLRKAEYDTQVRLSPNFSSILFITSDL